MNNIIDEELSEEEGSPAIFLRKVDVIIQNGEDEEPIIIKANPDEEERNGIGVQPDEPS